MEAKRIQATVPPPPPDQFQLTLSYEEARFLRKFAGCVAGGEHHLRKYYNLFSAIYDALGSVTVPVSAVGFTALDGGFDYVRIVDEN